jgi:hypothetical protein
MLNKTGDNGASDGLKQLLTSVQERLNFGFATFRYFSSPPDFFDRRHHSQKMIRQFHGVFYSAIRARRFEGGLNYHQLWVLLS